MNYIAHRRNTLEQLLATPQHYGIEVDIRSYGDKLVIHHDPLQEGELLLPWLQAYKHGTLILNVKEEGLEQPLLELMEQFGIEDFFFLDQSFPFLVKWANRGERRCAVRVSEYESIDTALTLKGRVDWIWVDCFSKFPLDTAQAEMLQQAGFRLCLVSPELQGRTGKEPIFALHTELQQLGIRPDAICTKTPELWQEISGE